jgi:hypothetical protein
MSDHWTRPPPRTPRPRGAPAVFTIFHGYPAELVAEWCGISVATARLYKAGKRKPSRAVSKLFLLHRDRRVLGATWRDWIIKPDSIVDPDGNETSRGQLHNYFWIVQFARRMAYDREDGASVEFEKLLAG